MIKRNFKTESGQEITLVVLGTGNVLIATATERNTGFPALVMENTDGDFKVGDEVMDADVSSGELAIMFKDTRSIDVVMKQLKRCKKKLVEKQESEKAEGLGLVKQFMNNHVDGDCGYTTFYDSIIPVVKKLVRSISKQDRGMILTDVCVYSPEEIYNSIVAYLRISEEQIVEYQASKKQ